MVTKGLVQKKLYSYLLTVTGNRTDPKKCHMGVYVHKTCQLNQADLDGVHFPC